MSTLDDVDIKAPAIRYMIVTKCNVCNGAHHVLPFILNTSGDWVSDCPAVMAGLVTALKPDGSPYLIKIKDDIPNCFKQPDSELRIVNAWMVALEEMEAAFRTDRE